MDTEKKQEELENKLEELQFQEDEKKGFIVKNNDFITSKFPNYQLIGVILDIELCSAVRVFNELKGFETILFLFDYGQVMKQKKEDQEWNEQKESEVIYDTYLSKAILMISDKYQEEFIQNKEKILFQTIISNDEANILQVESLEQSICLIEYDLFPIKLTRDQIRNISKKEITYQDLNLGFEQYVTNLLVSKSDIDYVEFQYGTGELSKVYSQISRCQNLEKLVFHLLKYNMNLQCLQDLTSSFIECKQIKTLCLYLSENRIDQNCMQHILNCVSKCQKISRLELNLRDNPIQKESFVSIGNVIKELKDLNDLQLNMSKTQMDLEDIEILSQCISENQCIKSILFSAYKSNINKEMVAALLSNFAKLQLESLCLYLSSNIFESHDLEVFNEHLRKLQNLKCLKLCLSEITYDQGVSGLAQAIGSLSNLNLLKLYFRKSSLLSKDIAELGQNISNISNLESLTLVLKRNEFSDLFLGQLAINLSKCSKLKNIKLNLNFCKLEDQDLIDFTKGLNEIKELYFLKLKLKSNNLSQNAVLEMQKNLQKCKHLQNLHLKLSLHLLNKEGIELILNETKLIPKLRSLTLRLKSYFYISSDFITFGKNFKQWRNIQSINFYESISDREIIKKSRNLIKKAHRLVQVKFKE